MTPAEAASVRRTLTKSVELDRLLVQTGKELMTPKLNSLAFKFATFTDKVEAAAEKLHARMDRLGDTTVGAIDKYGRALDPIEATAKALDDAANQMTNNPPLAVSAGSSPAPEKTY